MMENNQQPTKEGILYEAIKCANAVEIASKEGIYNNILKVGLTCVDVSEFDAAYQEAIDKWLAEDSSRSVPRNSTLRSAVSMVRQAIDYDIDLEDEDGELLSKNALYKQLKAAKGSASTTTTTTPTVTSEEEEEEPTNTTSTDNYLLVFAQTCKNILDNKEELDEETKETIHKIAQQLLDL